MTNSAFSFFFSAVALAYGIGWFWGSVVGLVKRFFR